MKIIKSRLLLNYSTLFILISTILGACVPKEQVVFKGVKNIAVDISISGSPVLKADANFFNPNKVKIKLKEINVEITVDGVKSADVKHELDVVINGKSDFTVPLVAQLTLKQNLLDAMVSLLGGKKYQVVFKGYIRVHVHGFTFKIPVSGNQELKLNI